jgi:hypothetical protein
MSLNRFGAGTPTRFHCLVDFREVRKISFEQIAADYRGGRGLQPIER